MADSADLVCLGGYYGTGRRAVAAGGLVSVFLMGCYDKASKTWKTVCKCGNGFEDEELDQFQHTLVPTMESFNACTDAPPAWLDIKKGLYPDFVVKDALEAPVWEVVGAGTV